MIELSSRLSSNGIGALRLEVLCANLLQFQPISLSSLAVLWLISGKCLHQSARLLEQYRRS